MEYFIGFIVLTLIAWTTMMIATKMDNYHLEATDHFLMGLVSALLGVFFTLIVIVVTEDHKLPKTPKGVFFYKETVVDEIEIISDSSIIFSEKRQWDEDGEFSWIMFHDCPHNVSPFVNATKEQREYMNKIFVPGKKYLISFRVNPRDNFSIDLESFYPID
jgi:hypothetical protein